MDGQGDNKSTLASPCGANISLAEQPTGDWASEFAAGPGFGNIEVAGYLANDWMLETLKVARLTQNSTNTTLQFSTYTPYGICLAIEATNHGLVNHCGGAAPGRLTVSGLLSEVDVPGEYWFDADKKKLYIFPPENEDGSRSDGPSGSSGWGAEDLAAVRLGHWSGPGLISISDSSYVTLRDVTISGVGGSTTVGISGGDHNTIGGCTLRNSAGRPTAISGICGHLWAHFGAQCQESRSP